MHVSPHSKVLCTVKAEPLTLQKKWHIQGPGSLGPESLPGVGVMPQDPMPQILFLSSDANLLFSLLCLRFSLITITAT